MRIGLTTLSQLRKELSLLKHAEQSARMLPASKLICAALQSCFLDLRTAPGSARHHAKHNMRQGAGDHTRSIG